MTNTDLKELLDALHDKYNSPDFIADDPISVPHRYTDRADREIAGFFSATIAWGNRKAIVRSGHRMMHFMDDAPADFVRNASQRELALLSSYVHRTFNGGDLRDFVLALRRMEERHGGIGNFFETRYEAAQSMPAVLADFRREFFAGSTLRAARSMFRPSSAARPASGCACICGGWCAATTGVSISVCGGVSRCRPSTCRWTSMSARRRVRWDCLAAARTTGGPSRS